MENKISQNGLNKVKYPDAEAKALCPLPFVHPFFDVRGLYSACCNGSFSEDSKHVSEMTAEQWFYSEDMRQLRHDMLVGNRNSMCDHCWKKDDLGIPSPRFTHHETWKCNNIDYENPKPQFFDLKPSNHCNLACIFCTASSSDKILKITKALDPTEQPSRWAGSVKAVEQREEQYGSTFDPHVVEYIKNNVNDLKIIKFTGGEPFLSKEVLEILKLISEKNPQVEIKITTNGTVITKDFYPILEKMKKISIKFSIDAVDDLYTYIRFPSKWDSFERRIENNIQSLPHVKFNVNCLITNMNLEQIPKIRNWFKQMQSKYPNLEYITIDPNLSPDTNESSLYMTDPVILTQIKEKIKGKTFDWDINDRTDKQLDSVLKKIDDAINNNLFDSDLKYRKWAKYEFQKQNNIRKIQIQDVVEPITQKFFQKLLIGKYS